VSVQVIRIGDALPESFAALADTARAEGYNFLDRLRVRWRDGAYLNDRVASVFAVFTEDRFMAIGAQTANDYAPSPAHRRMRHFYVHPEHRRSGIGRALAGALIQDAFQLAPILRLRATHDLSRAFWNDMGFAGADAPDCSHVLRRDDVSASVGSVA